MQGRTVLVLFLAAWGVVFGVIVVVALFALGIVGKGP